MKKGLCILLFFSVLLFACKPDDPVEPNECDSSVLKEPTPYQLKLPSYAKSAQQFFPKDNPLTVEGIALGRELFYEKKLSGDNTISCGSCHLQEKAFSDPRQFSIGVDGKAGDRNAMGIVNLVFSERLFWDGRAKMLEGQAFGPVVNPVEMHETWPNAASKIRADEKYQKMFKAAFGCDVVIDSNSIVNAIGQFERTLISFESKFDDYLNNKYLLTDEERIGRIVFTSERGDCFHCHRIGKNALFFDDSLGFRNNGLDTVFNDLGLENVTGLITDRGKFRAPTLRNIEYTAPYMHDGRFETLEEVIDHYSSGVKKSATIDPFMKKVDQGGLRLTNEEKRGLLAFLKLLSDKNFIENEAFSDPNK